MGGFLVMFLCALERYGLVGSPAIIYTPIERFLRPVEHSEKRKYSIFRCFGTFPGPQTTKILRKVRYIRNEWALAVLLCAPERYELGGSSAILLTPVEYF